LGDEEVVARLGWAGSMDYWTVDEGKGMCGWGQDVDRKSRVIE
jgi:hypothetical protein